MRIAAAKDIQSIKGHVVKKKALIRALKMPTKNPALTEEFVKTLLHLINSSPVQEITSTMRSDEEYHLHTGSSYTVMQLGAAAKLWLYIWIRCEEAGSKIDLNIRDCERTLDIAAVSHLRLSGGFGQARMLEQGQGRTGIGRCPERENLGNSFG